MKKCILLFLLINISSTFIFAVSSYNYEISTKDVQMSINSVMFTNSILYINNIPIIGPINVVPTNKSIAVILPLKLIYACDKILAEWITLNAYQGWKIYIIISDPIRNIDVLRSILRELYLKENLTGAVLIGHLNLYKLSEITFSQLWETYPMDLYLMDLDGEYIDSNHNGKIDYFCDPDGPGPADIYPEIFIGRIYPSNAKDINFIKNVLLKSVKVIGGEIPIMFNACVFIDDDWSWYYYEILDWFSPIYNITAVYDTNKTTKATFMKLISKKWGLFYQAIHSNGTHLFIANQNCFEIVSNKQITDYSIGGQIEILFSCSAAKYTLTGYLAEAYLRDNITIAVISSTKAGGIWYADSLIYELKKGKTIGEAFLRWFTDVISLWDSDHEFWYNQSWWAGMTIIGDPLFSLYPKMVSLHDSDNDGLVDEIEKLLGTSSSNIDTDNDGINDELEIIFGFNPCDASDANADFDQDGLTNVKEISIKTNPYDNDTDHDGIPDKWEVDHDLNPKQNDAWMDLDGDNLTNLEEYKYNTDPRNNDTDNDGMPDGWEVKYNLTPTRNDANEDSDEDWLKNLDEYYHGTNPHDSDTDNDGFSDFVEVLFSTNPCNEKDTPLPKLLALGFLVIIIISTIIVVRKRRKALRK